MPVYGPVGLLATHSSHELSEWIAWEQVNGPIGVKWDREVQAQLHELIQATNYLLGAQLSDEKHPNQVPKPAPMERAWDHDDQTASQAEEFATLDDETLEG